MAMLIEIGEREYGTERIERSLEVHKSELFSFVSSTGQTIERRPTILHDVGNILVQLSALTLSSSL